MASYHGGRQVPFLDARLEAALRRRLVELGGIGLVVLAGLIAAMLASYSPDDPNWLAATDRPARNLLGRTGATLAGPLVAIAGRAGWLLVPVLAVLGLRLIVHRGGERVPGALILAPITAALAALHFATLVPPADWPHAYGLGGLFGDTAAGALLNAWPGAPGPGLKAISAASLLALAIVASGALAIDGAEARALLRFLASGLWQALRGAGQLLRRMPSALLALAAAPRARTDTREGGGTPRRPAAPEPAPAPRQTPAGHGARLLARITPRRATPTPPPELVENVAPADAAGGVSEERIRARIIDAVRRHAIGTAGVDPEGAAPGHRPEPPLTAAARPGAQQPGAASGTPPKPREAGLVAPARTRLSPSARAEAEAQPSLALDDAGNTPAPAYAPPPLSLLSITETPGAERPSAEALAGNARMLETVLDDYGVKGEIVSVRPGPVVTMYELEPAPGLKASRVIGLADDIARSMSALSARVSTVPGRSVIGIELPNVGRETVYLRELLSSRDFAGSRMQLPLALGKTIGGEAVIANLAKMPHLLIAGTTGSGKSVAINTMILSLLYRLSPEQCRLIMIDPKMLELSVYDGIPHLLSPVVTDPKKAVVALKWVVAEMEDRYRKMSKTGVRNIEGYNARVREALEKGEMFRRTVQTGFDDDTGEPVFETEEFAPEAVPYIVVIVDEMADLMMVAGKEIEACIQRLAQMARASGIHLIMATQRPSVDVITGTIKANFPTRISFQVTSKVDSRTILGEQGAEQLLGQGDMLYMAGGARISRVHGPFVSDEEVEEVVAFLKSYGPPDYVEGVLDGPEGDRESALDEVLGLGGNTGGEDALYDQAVAIVAHDRKCSTSYIQRKLAIGYNKAARLVEKMEDEGVVSPANNVGKREILVPEA